MQRYATKRRDGVDVPLSVVLFCIEGQPTQLIKKAAPTGMQEAYVRQIEETFIIFGQYHVVNIRDWGNFKP